MRRDLRSLELLRREYSVCYTIIITVKLILSRYAAVLVVFVSGDLGGGTNAPASSHDAG